MPVDPIEQTKTAIAVAVADKLEDLNSDLLNHYQTEDEKQEVRDGYYKVGQAVAEALGPTLSYIEEYL